MRNPSDVERLIRFLRLGRRRRSLLIQAAVLLPAVDACLRIAGYNRTLSSLNLLPCGSVRRAGRDDPAGYRDDVAWSVFMASRHGLVQATCLRRALVIDHFLRRAGLASAIRFAARQGEFGIEAHAWVESDGRVVGDHPSLTATFTPLEPKPDMRPPAEADRCAGR